MTGNTAGLAVAAARRLIGYQESTGESGQSLTAIVLVVGFVAGCAAGAFAQTTVGVPGILLPAVLLLLIAAFYAPDAAQKPA